MSVGIPEDIWASVLSDATSWIPNAGPIVVLSPHPDDEVFGAGGTISMLAGTHQITVVSVTDGEHAHDHWPTSLADTRQAELSRALRCLTPHPVDLVRLRLEDGQVANSLPKLAEALERLVPPGCTLLVPFESDGHPDHDAIGEFGRQWGEQRGITVCRYPIWRWHHGDVATMRDHHWAKMMLTDEARAAKRRAIRCFTSQIAPPHRHAIVPPHVLTYFERPFEAFVL